MRRYALLLLACWMAPVLAESVTIYPRWHWGVDRNFASTCVAPTGIQCTRPQLLPKSATTSGGFDPTARWGASIRINPAQEGGYLSQPLQYQPGQGPFDGEYGAAWMAFVWLDEIPAHRSSVLWWEGAGIASFALMIETDATVTLTYGQGRAWRGTLRSKHRVGRNAWHHIAFVYQPGGKGTVRLLVNGIEEASAELPVNGGPDQSPAAPIAIGTYANRTTYDLEGLVDEIKLIQFSPASAYLDAVRSEHGLHFRNRVLADLIASGRIASAQVDDFREPTFHSTSLLRAHVSSFYTTGNASRPRDPLSPFPDGSGVGYVYPLFAQPSLYGPEAGSREGRYNSLYLNLSEPCVSAGPGCGEAGRARVTGFCGSASLTLWAVYKVFGYSARRYDYINAAEFDYTDSHSLTSVYIRDVAERGYYLLQDPTYNVSGRTADGDFSIEQLTRFASEPPTLDDGGYNFFGAGPNRPVWSWSSQYWTYFDGLVTVFPAWQK